MTDNLEITADIGTDDEVEASIETENAFTAEFGDSSDKHYTHTQAVPSDTWEICHNLGKYCSVTIVDSAGTVVIGQIDYTDTNNCVVRFNGAFSGKAYCN